MKCRQCSAEIAEKAIVCYRCGTPTAELAEVPRHAPPAARGRFVLIIVLVVIALAIAAYVLLAGRPNAATNSSPDQRGQHAAGAPEPAVPDNPQHPQSLPYPQHPM